MDTYALCLSVIGLAALGMAWMPALAKRTNISYSIYYVLAGFLLYAIIPDLPAADPFEHYELTLHFSELVVILSIMGTGLKIDQPFKLKYWGTPFRLVSITMLLCIGGVAFVAHYFFQMSLPSAVLLGAVLSPTDPVLASDVQVGPPLENDCHTVRFSLTSEAGMNDGAAFPFTWLAIILASGTAVGSKELLDWFWIDLLYKIACGVAVGFLIGKLLAYLVINLPQKNNSIQVKDGLVGVAATLMVYGITELVHGYGFIAVFVTAITLRNYEMHHHYHKRIHKFTDQVERLMVAIVLLLFGGALASGILKPLTTSGVIIGLLFLFVIRPVSGLIALIKTPLHITEKLAIGFYGIRGIGSFYYLAFALTAAVFTNAAELWSIVSFIVLVSIIIHGLTASIVMKKLEERFNYPSLKAE